MGIYKGDCGSRILLFMILPVSQTPNVKNAMISKIETDHVSTLPNGSGESNINTIPQLMINVTSLSNICVIK